jgi:hypothetical protein
MRGRNRNNNGNKGPNPLTRSYESNGPDVKVRGTAQHVAEKYMQLARDAQAGGDPVAAESYLQHAEHYIRIVLAAHEQLRQQYGENYRPQRPFGLDDQEEGDEDDGDDSVDPGHAPQPGLRGESDAGADGDDDAGEPRPPRFDQRPPRDFQGRDGQRHANGRHDGQPRQEASRNDNGRRFDRNDRRFDRRERFERDRSEGHPGETQAREGQPRDRQDERGERQDRPERDRPERERPERERQERPERRFERGDGDGEGRFERRPRREERRPERTETVSDEPVAALPAFVTAPVRPVPAAAVVAEPVAAAPEVTDAPAPRRRGRPPKKRDEAAEAPAE